jgi:CRISPR-associated protein Cas2
MFVLMTYDVPADRTGIYRKILRRYLNHKGYSVFYGDIPMSLLEKLRGDIRKVIEEGDNIIEICSENRHNVSVCRWLKSGSNGIMEKMIDEGHRRDADIL